MACTALIHIYLLVDELVVYRDVVVVHLVLAANLGLEGGSYGNVELKLQGTVALEVQLCLLVAGQRLAKHLNLVLTNISVQLLAQHLVHHVHLDLSAELALYHAHRSHAGTETGDVSTLAIVF